MIKPGRVDLEVSSVRNNRQSSPVLPSSSIKKNKKKKKKCERSCQMQ